MNKFFMALILLLMGCVGIPENVKPVENFKLESYLDKWYEIARLNHSFERGLSRLTADYSLRDDGGLNLNPPLNNPALPQLYNKGPL